ncbi:MAG: nitrilase-related carbon-nitrogen hydrolase [Candidatus Omnitrophota bacterium]
MLQVAVIQMASGPDKEKNLSKAIELTVRALAKKAALVCLPEYFYYRGPLKTEKDRNMVFEPVNGPTVKKFAATARDGKAHILLGSIYEQSRVNGRAFNTSVLIGPDGKVQAVYRKNNLFHIRLGAKETREADVFLPGRTAAPTKVRGFTLGMTLCFDVRFPGLYEQYARRGVNLFTIPASFARTTGKAHWELLVRARAVETFSYVLAPAQVGCGADGTPSWGQSLIIDPWGRILARASNDREEILYARLDPAAPARFRRMFPGYKNIN